MGSPLYSPPLLILILHSGNLRRKNPEDRSIASFSLGPRHRADARPKTIRVTTAVAGDINAPRVGEVTFKNWSGPHQRGKQ